MNVVRSNFSFGMMHRKGVSMKHKMIKKVVAGSVSATLAFAPLMGNACTSFTLKGSDGGVVYGRSMEMGFPLHSQLTLMPRNFTKQGIGPDGKVGGGLTWTTKYAVAGMNAVGMPEYSDGMNEKGLIGGMQNAPNTAKYQTVTPADAANSISSAQVVTYVLTNFATVNEIKAGLQKIKVSGVPVPSFGNQVPTQHYGFHDATGKSVVVEYIKGELVVTDNPTGAMTNDPAFSAQLNSIGNYANLTKSEKPALVINGATFVPPSSGSGLHGLPGDYLSPSRFIRAVFLTDSVPKSYTSAQMHNAAWHILGSFDIPPGAVTLPANNPYGGGVGGIEITEWSTVADTKSMTYSIKMFENMNVYEFDLKKMDVNAKDIKYIKLDKPASPMLVN